MGLTTRPCSPHPLGWVPRAAATPSSAQGSPLRASLVAPEQAHFGAERPRSPTNSSNRWASAGQRRAVAHSFLSSIQINSSSPGRGEGVRPPNSCAQPWAPQLSPPHLPDHYSPRSLWQCLQPKKAAAGRSSPGKGRSKKPRAARAGYLRAPGLSGLPVAGSRGSPLISLIHNPRRSADLLVTFKCRSPRITFASE